MKGMVRLQDAAERLGVEEHVILELASDGLVSIAVYADSWIAHDATERDSGHMDVKAGTERVLNNTWLYLRPGYVPNLARLKAGESYPPGKFRSRPDGPVDTWVSPKPRVRKEDLYLRDVDLEHARRELSRASELADAARGTDPTDHDLALQEKANQIASEEIGRGVPKRRLSRKHVAGILAKKVGMNPDTVERRIRKKW